MKSRHLLVTALSSAFIGLAGCSTVAVTGRSQLNMMSDTHMINVANQSYSQLMSSYNSKGAILREYDSKEAENAIASVKRVSDRIIDAAGLRHQYQWEVTVVKSSTPNAFVMPNGKIVVYTGILPIAKNEAGLAAIIGHEVAHVVAKHGAERASQSTLSTLAVQVAATAVAVNSQAKGKSNNSAAIGAALGFGAQFGVLMPFSRLHESEADRIGQIYMAKAGYDPAEAIAVWQRMEQQTGKSQFEFVSTHPGHGTRQQQLTQWLPQAQEYYRDRNKPLPKSL
jgi:predicted Zn-dependent protease